MTTTAAEWVTPGTRLGSARDFTAGAGCYVRGTAVYASLVGRKRVSGTALCVEGAQHSAAFAAAPTVGSVATAKITKINPRFATASIVLVDDAPLREPFVGIVRAADVRATDIDSVVIQKCFRPGDVIVAEIISLGDARSFYLSTARTEHGVVYAKSAAGVAMVPVSWNQMLCPKTHAVEPRKVAKVAATAAAEKPQKI